MHKLVELYVICRRVLAVSMVSRDSGVMMVVY